jgi:hypothetical protein
LPWKNGNDENFVSEGATLGWVLDLCTSWSVFSVSLKNLSLGMGALGAELGLAMLAGEAG